MDSRTIRRLTWLDDHLPIFHGIWLWLFNREILRQSRAAQQRDRQAR